VLACYLRYQRLEVRVGPRNKQICSMWLQETSVVCPIARLGECTEMMNSDGVGVLLL
jgi:hypothetical protein